MSKLRDREHGSQRCNTSIAAVDGVQAQKPHVVDPTTVPTINRTKLETVEPSPPLSVLVECPSESSYRGRRRRGETATSSQPSRGSSIFLNPVEEKSDCGRWTGSIVPKDPALPPSFPPGDGDGSRYRGRRRAQIS